MSQKIFRQNRGQLSIEYLLLSAALLAVFAIVLSAAAALFQSALFAVDAKNAVLFSNELEKNIDYLGLLSSGSQIEMDAKPMSEWHIFFSSGRIFVQAENKSFGQKKSASFFPALTPKITAVIVKQNSKVLLLRAGGFVLIKNG